MNIFNKGKKSADNDNIKLKIKMNEETRKLAKKIFNIEVDVKNDTLNIEVKSYPQWYPFLNYIEFIENEDKIADAYKAYQQLYELSKLFKCKHKGQYQSDCDICEHRYLCLTQRW